MTTTVGDTEALATAVLLRLRDRLDELTDRAFDALCADRDLETLLALRSDHARALLRAEIEEDFDVIGSGRPVRELDTSSTRELARLAAHVGIGPAPLVSGYRRAYAAMIATWTEELDRAAGSPQTAAAVRVRTLGAFLSCELQRVTALGAEHRAHTSPHAG